ncbi:BppU family phage baseplate upper protein [Terrihalobacillus insolitus]|uniref:BppU family phage baseplate upper protein n=1 Tax=Terrihalobacillus insolitus TaxID=2950438 RepID=UPI0023416B49|nr:BppU family phage baseplate upper protein [Terrihalobacillus insolitus]MDC3412520.1 phage baseplate upper protein [Terrihalobacillus insolitus]
MDIINKRTITVDLRQNTVISLPQFIQNDNNIIEFDIKDNGVSADLTNIGRIVVNYKRPDGVAISRLLDVVNGVVSYTIGIDEMKIAGYGELEIQFFDTTETERISTKRMKVNMLKSIGTDKIYENTDELTLLESLFAETDTAKTNANDAATYANNQGDYAKESGDSTKINWLGVLANYADLPASPVLGDTYQVENDATASNNGTWRWDSVDWIKINSPQAYDNRIVSIENGFSKHLTEIMPHQIQDLDTGKTYHYGLQIKNGVTQFIYEEVI